MLKRWPRHRALAAGRSGIATTATVGRTTTSVAPIGVAVTIVAVRGRRGGVGGGALELTTASGQRREAAGVAFGVARAGFSSVGDED